MCGIYGITDHDPVFIQNYIRKCKHRGPDAQKVWWDPDYKMTLGHNLLSIMGNPKVAVQPWKTPKGNWLVYNGEIFNYYDLKQRFKNIGFAGITGCDTELLAWGLDTFGAKFVHEIDSMHAFAYYQPKKNKLILSRDHAGIKPLYYAEIKEGLVFGSEVRGLLDKVPNSHKLDKLSHSIWHYMSNNPLRNTFFNNIKKLLPGETLIYDTHHKKIQKYYREFIKPTNDYNYDPIEFKQVVNRSVKNCSIGDKKIGLFLSGGMDSTMISKELLDITGTVNSFTTRFVPDPNTREEDYNEDANMAKRLAEHFKFNHTEIPITPEIYASYWNQSVSSVEQIIRTPTLPANLYTNKVMKDHNIKVTIAGDLGDELMCGYPRHGKLLHDFSNKAMSWKDICKVLVTQQKPATKVNENIHSADDVLQEFIKQFPDTLYNEQDPLGSFCALECVTICPEDMLIRNDKFGMAYSMEGRYPLASKQFMKYCFSINSKQKISKKLKHMSRDAYKNVLPSYIINKGKTGWTAPMAYWIKQNPSLLNLYEQKMKHKMDPNMKITQKTGKWLAIDMMWATWFEAFKIANY
jgi:asparagine synthase (glutamine-hydrolysing)